MIHGPADLPVARSAFLNAIWGAAGLPLVNRASAIGQFRPDDIGDAIRLKRRGIPTQGAISGRFRSAEELSAKVVIGGHIHETWAYHLRPTVEPVVERLVIVHHGHDDSFHASPFRMDEALAHLLGSGHAVLAMYMPNYGPAPRMPPDVLPEGDRHGPIFTQPGLSSTTDALQVFLEPVIACLNYLQEHFRYREFHMVGLSGGGWTTVLCAAADPRIRVSVSVSGSLPLDLRFGGSLGDEEQMHEKLFHEVIGYRDLYALAGYGPGRRHLQVLYDEDDCCFSDWQWPARSPTSLEEELEKYEFEIRGRLAGVAGSFELTRLSDNATRHSMSRQAIAIGTSAIDGILQEPP